MKKFMKHCAILAFVFAVAGCILGLIGSTVAGGTAVAQALENATGGRFHLGPGRWWNWHWIEKEEVIDDISDIIDGGTVDYDINDVSMFDDDYGIMNGNVDRYCPGTDIRNLEIEVGGCQLETRSSGDDSIYLEVENAHKFQGYVSEGTLYIRATAGSALNWTDIGKRKIMLYLPDGFYFDEANIEVGAGELRLDDLYTDKAKLEVGAGLIILESAQVQDLEVSVGAGGVQLNDMLITELNAEIGMGEFLAEGILNGDADVSCSMGNIEMTLEGSEEEFNYRLEGSMGNISVGQDSFSGFSSERNIDNHADKEMEIECSMGNITIDFRH